MDQWEEKNNALEQLFVFDNFEEALQFVNKVGEVAEEMNHHPTITLQNYKEVLIITTTHDAGNTVTEKDQKLAQKISELPKH